VNETGQAVASTGLLVAAIRADESARSEPLFVDPFAERLAGSDGRRLLAAAVATTGEKTAAQIVVRTRFWDDALLGWHRNGVRQFVILAAGMDARAYRLPLAGATVYELDQPAVLERKNRVLADEQTRCTRLPIGVDLTEDWTQALRDNGFTPHLPTVWLVEGLLQYLDEDAVRGMFERVDALSAPGSALLYDVVGRTLRDAPFMEPLKTFMVELGAPWLFATDAPGELAGRHGWSVVVTDVATPGNEWNRWFAPATPLSVPGVPRGYFVEATKPA
jgi:methyltransferase (TIGR00027 family)